MPFSEERKEQARKHNSLMKGAFASETAASVEAATIYEEGEMRSVELPEARFEETKTVVTTSFIPAALYRFGEGACAVVDQASFTRPGGAYLDGASGPEQTLCAESNLYEALCGIKDAYHGKNRDYRRGMLFTDRAAYLPDIAFSHGGEVRKAGVIVIAAPMRARALENHRSERECDHELANRINTIMNIAAAQQCDTLVCNAFACGRTGFAAHQVVELFKSWIDAHPGAIGTIVFSVSRAFMDDFSAAFDQSKPEPVQPAQPQEGSDEADDEDWRSIDLPEGVTLR